MLIIPKDQFVKNLILKSFTLEFVKD